MTSSAIVDLAALGNRAARYVARIERFPAYEVASEARQLQAFEAGEPVVRELLEADDYFARVIAATRRGVVWERFRVVDTPLTGYQRWQLAYFLANNQRAGERIWVAERADLPYDIREDAWLFDGLAVAQDYDLQGRFLGRYFLRDDQADQAFLDARAIREVAVPLDSYLPAIAPRPRVGR